MPLPVTLIASYLAANFAIMVWIVREEAHGRVPPPWVTTLSSTMRYGPPLLGVVYLVTIAGDWPFVLFVIGFFAVAFWLLDGHLNYPERPPPKR
jgi:hypothetical protein